MATDLSVPEPSGRGWILDDAPVPSAQAIIDRALPKPWLGRWAAREAAAYAVGSWRRLSRLDEAAREDAIRRAPWAPSPHRELAEQLRREATGVWTGEPLEGAFTPALQGWVQAQDIEVGCHDRIVWETRGTRPTYADRLDVVARLGRGPWLLITLSARDIVYGELRIRLAAQRYAAHVADAAGSGVEPWDLRSWPVTGAAVLYVPTTPGMVARLVMLTAGPREFATFRALHRTGLWLRGTRPEAIA